MFDIKHGICVDFGLIVVSALGRCNFIAESILIDDRIDPEKRKGILSMFIEEIDLWPISPIAYLTSGCL